MNEADEIGDEDLEAASDMLSQLQAGTLYETIPAWMFIDGVHPYGPDYVPCVAVMREA